jgi:hypothetical protein
MGAPPEARQIARPLKFHYIPEACQLVECGRDRVIRVKSVVSGSANFRHEDFDERSCLVGKATQRSESNRQLALLANCEILCPSWIYTILTFDKSHTVVALLFECCPTFHKPISPKIRLALNLFIFIGHFEWILLEEPVPSYQDESR